MDVHEDDGRARLGEAALYPMVRDGQVNISSVFEPPIWHHPNVAGHRHLGAIVAKYLERGGRGGCCG